MKYITAISKDNTTGRIVLCEVRESLGTNSMYVDHMKVENIIKEIDAGENYYTAVRDQYSFVRGEEISVVEGEDCRYIRSLGNERNRDNLECLPLI